MDKRLNGTITKAQKRPDTLNLPFRELLFPPTWTLTFPTPPLRHTASEAHHTPLNLFRPQKQQPQAGQSFGRNLPWPSSGAQAHSQRPNREAARPPLQAVPQAPRRLGALLLAGRRGTRRGSHCTWQRRYRRYQAEETFSLVGAAARREGGPSRYSMFQEDWNTDVGDEASSVLPLFEEAAFSGRQNGPLSDFQTGEGLSVGSFGTAAENQNRWREPVSTFGNGRNSANRGVRGEQRNRPQCGNFGGSRRRAFEGSAAINVGMLSIAVPYKDNEEKGSEKGPKVTYVPPPPPDDENSIFAHYETGINFDKYDENVVEVSGLNAPAPLLNFEEANFCQTLKRNIAKAGYSKLTPVQRYSIPIVLSGRDLMACAQTGSGKTAAFLLPIVSVMMRDGVTASSFKEQQEPECIIVAPTRELINQIFLEARKFVYGTCIRPVVMYGGTQTGHSIRQVMQGCNILCATPGRLLDIIERDKIGLQNVKYLVLDEADRMLDMGFGLDMKKLVSYPSMPSKDERQTLMFSATFPVEVQRLAGEFLKSNYLFVVVGLVGGACSDIQQNILQVPEYSKRDKLIEILQSIGHERTMVFVGRKIKADYIAAFLCQEKISATSIHGDREQRERELALQDFRSGKSPVLVATSVAARGLDIENVQHVINFDLPSTIEEYVHRIGRTGRCGNTGKAVCFFDSTSDGHLAQPLVKVLSDAHQEVPCWLEEIAFGFQEGVFTTVNTQKNYRSGGNVNPGEKKYSASELESWG
ncbi:probable ATP-dependent RNA helicase DDX4 [Dryobates pubescens]|uniref:probable ATP-dependent RNA helicase DDX4 n=1 Tax=Dryobates pubescens TaxID=118200 RepID=UPI0023B95BA6|nr:probable ATP-dependent RNA helicase DDX4 [Dryobates pubescens]